MSTLTNVPGRQRLTNVNRYADQHRVDLKERLKVSPVMGLVPDRYLKDDLGQFWVVTMCFASPICILIGLIAGGVPIWASVVGGVILAALISWPVLFIRKNVVSLERARRAIWQGKEPEPVHPAPGADLLPHRLRVRTRQGDVLRATSIMIAVWGIGAAR